MGYLPRSLAFEILQDRDHCSEVAALHGVHPRLLSVRGMNAHHDRTTELTRLYPGLPSQTALQAFDPFPSLEDRLFLPKLQDLNLDRVHRRPSTANRSVQRVRRVSNAEFVRVGKPVAKIVPLLVGQDRHVISDIASLTLRMNKCDLPRVNAHRTWMERIVSRRTTMPPQRPIANSAENVVIFDVHASRQNELAKLSSHRCGRRNWMKRT